MKRKSSKKKSILYATLFALVICLLFSVPAFAITEDEVQAQVNASSKEAVAGNVLIWFLCAVAFLKVSQKIDSFMASIGVNVGHTGGSMLSDVLVVSRALGAAVKNAGHAFGGGGGGSSGSRSGASSNTATSSFFQGGLAGMVSRAVNNSAVKTATENKASTNSVQSDMAREAVYSAAHSDSSSTIHSSAPSPGSNGSSNGGVGASAPGGVSSTANPIVQPEAGSGIPSAPTDSPVTGGEGSPIPGAVSVSDANPIAVNEAEDENEVHPIPTSDPGITIHAAPAASADSGEGTASMESAVQSPAVEVASGGASISTSGPGNSGGEAASIPQSIPQSDPGIIPTAETPSGGETRETINPTSDTVMPPSPAPAEGGIGVSVNTSSETDATTVNSNTSENVSMPVTSNPSNTVKAPGTDPASGPSAPAGSGGTVLHTDSQQRTVSSSSKESSSQTTRTQATHSSSSQTTVQTERAHSYGLGGAMFMRSLASGGSFANDIIGKVATGSAQTTGTISGDMASQAMNSYMGYAAIGSPPASTPTYTDVEIGGGRITGIETAPGGGQSIQFTMYHTDQYAEPRGDYTKVVSADGATWYKQYAQDAVERKPYQAPDNTMAYQETIVKRMPDPPRRKDKM